MQLKGKTILITGGASGIGLEAAKQFLANGARVIITGRSQGKLDEAKKMYPAITAVKSDVSDAGDAQRLFNQMQQLGGIDILYNNAGVLTDPINLGIANGQHFEDAAYEMNVNYLAVIRLNNLFIDMLKSKKESAIINTTSLLSYVPSLLEATYAASKVALQFYTKALRKHLQILNSSVKVFELLPPLVATEMTTGMNGKKMTTADMVKAFITGLKKDQLNIRIGDTKAVYILNRLFPKLTFNLANPKKSYKVIAS
ncbi:SDR family oxidoreductase [Mucilaginibacter pocheonensis]|uniref:Short-subunit dehydrogenase involved in D-alanine esterification of teichoic acids n=1 Tax=Mucilaginibacter pocheonensis TaxID=398050 RepID=A0ABU1TFU5_9SPHI|nr:SDR family NAD(P)-dependent oxidoreductase [Mucilaginibacter pocheonensis]MDR6944075.1 short-subunit dehydrogenase involved in D-alanine esterification of teichoic acids [Mucilaginibacter pocheonensis]